MRNHRLSFLDTFGLRQLLLAALLIGCFSLSPAQAQSWQERLTRRIERRVNDDIRSLYLREVPVKTAKKLSGALVKPLNQLMAWRKSNLSTLELYSEFFVAQGFAFYEESDPEKAAKYYLQAHKAAKTYLAQHSCFSKRPKLSFEQFYALKYPQFKTQLQSFDKGHYPALFWFAFSQGMTANLQRKTQQIAEVPKLKAIFQFLLSVDESYFHAGPHLALGLLECILPKAAGRDLARGRKHFEAVQRLTDGHWLLGQLIRARTYSVALQGEFPSSATMVERHDAARRAWDDYFRQLETIRAYNVDDRPELRLYSRVCRQRALSLLQNAEDHIFPPPGVSNPYEEEDQNDNDTGEEDEIGEDDEDEAEDAE